MSVIRSIVSYLSLYSTRGSHIMHTGIPSMMILLKAIQIDQCPPRNPLKLIAPIKYMISLTNPKMNSRHLFIALLHQSGAPEYWPSIHNLELLATLSRKTYPNATGFSPLPAATPDLLTPSVKNTGCLTAGSKGLLHDCDAIDAMRVAESGRDGGIASTCERGGGDGCEVYDWDWEWRIGCWFIGDEWDDVDLGIYGQISLWERVELETDCGARGLETG